MWCPSHNHSDPIVSRSQSDIQSCLHLLNHGLMEQMISSPVTLHLDVLSLPELQSAPFPPSSELLEVLWTSLRHRKISHHLYSLGFLLAFVRVEVGFGLSFFILINQVHDDSSCFIKFLKPICERSLFLVTFQEGITLS